MNLKNNIIYNEYQYIDLFKFIFAICIIGIHTSFYPITILRYFTLNLVYRTAVPFFFIASGFFLGRKVYSNINAFEGTIRKSLRRLFIILIVFEPLNIFLRFFESVVFGDIPIREFAILAVKSIVFYPWGALWYVQATLFAILFLIPFMKWHKESLIIPMGLVLYFIGALFNTYFFIIEDTYSNVVHSIMDSVISFRNGLFVGFLYVGMGLIISKFETQLKSVNIRFLFFITFFAFMLLAAEVYLVRGLHFVDDKSLFFSHILFVPLLFILLIKLKYQMPFDVVILRNLSTSFYILHRPIITILSTIYLLIAGEFYSNNLPFLFFTLTILILIIILWPIYKYKIKPFYYLLK